MRIKISPLMFMVEAYRANLVVTVRKHCLWLGWFPHRSTPIRHPDGNSWGLWKEDGEWFSLCGPLLVTLVRV